MGRDELTGRCTSPHPAALPRFYRSLSVMFSAGIPLHRSLDQLAQYSEDPVLVETCRGLTRDLEMGRSFASSLKRYPHVFNDFVTSTMRVAETSGKLHAALKTLADHEEWSLRNRMKLKSALVYPAFSLSLCLLMVLLGPSYLLRGQLDLLRSSEVELPLLTQMLILLSDGLRSWPVVLLGLGLLTLSCLGFQRWLRTPKGRLQFYRLLGHIPVLSRVLWVSAVSRFSRSLSLLLDAGVLLSSALPLATAASSNPWFARRAGSATERVLAGETMLVALKQTEAFDGIFYTALEAGEQSGSVSQAMTWIATSCDLELEAALDRLVSVVEPLLMLFTGLCVGLLLVATMLPTVKLLESL